MVGYLNTERTVVVLAEAKKEAQSLKLEEKLNKVVERLKKNQSIKGYKKIEPKSANTYEVRLTIKWRAYLVFEGSTPIIFRVGDHL